MQQRPDDPLTVEDLMYQSDGDWLACPSCLAATPAEYWFQQYIERHGPSVLAREVKAQCYDCGNRKLAVFSSFPFETHRRDYPRR